MKLTGRVAAYEMSKDFKSVLNSCTPLPASLIQIILDYCKADLVEGKFHRKVEVLGPLDVDIIRDTLAVCEYSGHKIQIWSARDFRVKLIIGNSEGSKDDQLAFPSGVALAGDLAYVADYQNNRVQVFDLQRQGAYVQTLRVVKEKALLAGVAVSDREVFAVNQGTGKILVFHRSTGDYIREWPERLAVVVPSCPIFFDGELWISDTFNHVVKVFNVASGSLSRTLGPQADRSTSLQCPIGLVVTPRYVYVGDNNNFRNVILNKEDGKMVLSWPDSIDPSRRIADGQLCNHCGMALRDDEYGSELVVADFGNNRVQTFQ